MDHKNEPLNDPNNDCKQQGNEQDDTLLDIGLMNIESSTAFKFLNSLQSKEQISSQHLEQLKQKHHDLHQHILTAFEYEKSMVKKNKELESETARQKAEFDKAGSKGFDNNVEMGELKRELIRYQNEVVLANERLSKLNVEIESSTVVKEGLVEDIEVIQQHKTEIIEPQLVSSTKEIRLELIQRRHQTESLEEDIEDKEKVLDTINKEKDRCTHDRESLELAFAKANEAPAKIIAQSDVFRNAIESLKTESIKQASISENLDGDMEKLTRKKRDLGEEKALLMTQVDQKKEDILDQERIYDTLFNDQAMAKQVFEVQEQEKLRLETAIRKVEADHSSVSESLLSQNREKDQLVKEYRKLEGVANFVLAQVPNMHQRNKEIQISLEAAAREAKFHQDAVRSLRKEIDILIHAYIEKDRTSALDKDRFQAQFSANRDLSSSIDQLSNALSVLERSIHQANYEREIKVREKLKLEMKLKNCTLDLQQRDMLLVDIEKKQVESIQSAQALTILFDKVRTERNKYVNLTTSNQQKCAEIKDKVNILQSEIDILGSESKLKDKQLNRVKMENTQTYAKRDNAKLSLNKLQLQFREKRSSIDEHAGNIDALTGFLTNCANNLTHLKSTFDKVTSQHNTNALRFLERNDELALLFNKLNLLKETIKNGDQAIQDLDEDIHACQAHAKELERSIYAFSKRVPQLNQLAVEHESLKAQLFAAKDQLEKLSKLVETPTENRIRYLKGTDATQAQLNTKVQDLETRLAEKEERLLEKDLVLEEITHLTDKLQKRAQLGRNETVTVMTQINAQAHKHSSIMKAMMANVAELSINKNLSMALKSEIQSKTATVNCLQYLLNTINQPTRIPSDNLSPTDMHVIDELNKECRAFIHQNRALSKVRKDRFSLEQGSRLTYQLDNGSSTTAKPRPGAYLPLDSDLPIAKPYGGHQPFHPTLFANKNAGGNLKYYRKPKLKKLVL